MNKCYFLCYNKLCYYFYTTLKHSAKDSKLLHSYINLFLPKYIKLSICLVFTINDLQYHRVIIYLLIQLTNKNIVQAVLGNFNIQNRLKGKKYQIVYTLQICTQFTPQS